MEPIKVKWEELEFSGYDGGGTPIYKYDGKYLTGIIEEYDETGNIIGEIEYKNGYREGVQRQYFKNGQIKQEYYERDNLLDGTFKKWDVEGKLISESEWKKGKKSE